MDKVKAFIINYNRLTLPKNMIEYLSDVDGIDPIIVDNNSDYPPLLEWYESCPFKIIRLKDNFGNCVVFRPDSGILNEFGLETDGRFIITDPDLDLSGIPKDFMHILHLGLDRHQFACKSGFSLMINDLPDNEVTKEVLQWETGYWSNKLDEYFYSAFIDTTFCLMRKNYHDFPSVRTGMPYTAIHKPWYYTKDNIPEDELYYLNSIMRQQSCYSEKILRMVNK